jgi:hypothetical protein
MATYDEVEETMLGEMQRIAENPRIPDAAKARLLLQFAEALAWLRAPGQSHGSSGSDSA